MDECLDGPEGCKGKVEYRMPLSPSGKSFPRCDFHWDKRLDFEEETTQKYGHWNSDVAPSWFNRSWGGMNEYGESWDDE